MTHFLLLTHGTRGDVDPFIAIGASLRRRGHRVTVFTHEAYRTAADAAGVPFEAVDEEAAYAAHLRRAAEVIKPRSGAAMREFYRDRELFLDRVGIAGGLRQLRREISLLASYADEVVVVGRHTFCLSGMIVAEMTGSPLCLVAPAPGYITIAPAVALHLAQSVGSELNEIRREHGLSETVNWSAWISRCDLRLGLWPQWFDEAGQRAPAGTALVGFPLADRSDPDPRIAAA